MGACQAGLYRDAAIAKPLIGGGEAHTDVQVEAKGVDVVYIGERGQTPVLDADLPELAELCKDRGRSLQSDRTGMTPRRRAFVRCILRAETSR